MIKFYLVNYNRKWKTYDECYNYHLGERYRYHNEYGKDGFLSERTTECLIPQRAKHDADFEWEADKKMCGGMIKIIQIDPEDKNKISEIEKSDGFVRWIEPRQIPEKGKKYLKYTDEDMING